MDCENIPHYPCGRESDAKQCEKGKSHCGIFRRIVMLAECLLLYIQNLSRMLFYSAFRNEVLNQIALILNFQLNFYNEFIVP